MINVEQLSFGYRRQNPIFEDLSFGLSPGSVYGLLGVNGVGKTSLLNLLAGLLFPDLGKIEFDGEPASNRKPSLLARVYYVPVDFELPDLKVERYYRRYAGFYPKFDKEIWDNALSTFGIKSSDRSAALSFGQKKKVLLSFALASGCDLLLLDEPTDGLDIPSKDSFRRLLSTHIGECRIAVVATHHIHDVANLIDHLMVLKDNRLILNNSLSELAQKFYTVMNRQQPSDALYSERNVNGFHSLLLNESGEEAALDLELLFKAVQINPEFINNSNHAQQ